MRTFKYSRILEKRRRAEVECNKSDHSWRNMVAAGYVHEGTKVLQCKKCWLLVPVSTNALREEGIRV